MESRRAWFAAVDFSILSRRERIEDHSMPNAKAGAEACRYLLRVSHWLEQLRQNLA